MRLALIYDRFLPGGGLEGYLLGLTRQFVADGHDVHVITHRSDAESEAIGAEVHKVDLTGCYTDSAKLRAFADRSVPLAESLEPDISIGFGRTTQHDLHRAGGGCHAEYSEKVLSLHKRLRPKNRTELALERELYTGGKTRAFVVNSEMVADQLHSRYGVDRELLHIIHTAVDSAAFSPADPAVRDALRAEISAETKADPEATVFLILSLDHRRKGLPQALEAFAAAEDQSAQLWIVGTALKPAHHRRIKALGLSDRVHYLGRTTEPVRYYRAADFFLHPTLYDACANTVLQSMATGLPGLISARDGAAGRIEDGGNGFVIQDPTDIPALTDLINRANSLPAGEYSALSFAARSSVLSLTWEKHARDWTRLVESVRIPR